MKYSPEAYAFSLDAALASAKNDQERDAILRRFPSVLAKYGDAGRSKRIFDAFVRIAARRRGGRSVQIEIARPLSDEMMKKLKGACAPHDHVDVVVNPALVAGVRITIDQERELDLSFASRVKKMLNV